MSNNFETKEYKEKQAEFFQSLRNTQPANYDKYFAKYLKDKLENQYRRYRNITPKDKDSDVKASANKINGSIESIEDILIRTGDK